METIKVRLDAALSNLPDLVEEVTAYCRGIELDDL